MLRHTLYEMASRDATVDPSACVALGGRTRFTCGVTTSAATGLTIVLEWSATGLDNTWTQLLAVAAAAAGTITKRSYSVGQGSPDFAVPLAARYIRARVTAAAAAQAFELYVEGAFFEPVNVPADKATLTKDLQSYDFLSMIADRAENDVLEELLIRVTGALSDALYGYGSSSSDAYRSPSDLFTIRSRSAGGAALYPDIVSSTSPARVERAHDQARPPLLDFDLTQSGAGDAIRREIVTQAEHLFRREMLSRSSDPGAHKTLRELSIIAPDLCHRLVKRRGSTATTWRGR